jgi:hypothetical protein
MLGAGGGFIVPGSTLKGPAAVQGGVHHAQRRGDAAVMRDRACGELLDMCGVRALRGQDETSVSVGRRDPCSRRGPDRGQGDSPDAYRCRPVHRRVLPGALYTMEALETGTFDLTVEPMAEIAPELGRQIRGLQWLALEDLNDGFIGTGGGAARGYGSVTVDFGSASGLPSLSDARGSWPWHLRGPA